MHEVLSTALNYRACGLSVIPLELDGSRKPALRTWDPYTAKLATEREITDWFRDGNHGIGIIGGPVSGGLEIIDLESIEIAKAWQQRVKEAGGEALLKRLLVVKTPKGFHAYYRCDEPGRNKDLARRPATEAELAAKPELKYYKLIETRGDRGFVAAPGSPPETHPKKIPYKVVQGTHEAINKITMAEREVLLDAARSLNEWFAKAYAEPQPETTAKGDQPGDLFEAKATWAQILQPKGWRQSAPGRWVRPGGKRDSAMEILGGKKLWCFSSSVGELPFEQAVSKFATYAMLHHEGNFQKAAKQLAADGFKPKQPEKKQRSEVMDFSPEQEEPRYQLPTLQLSDLMKSRFPAPRWAIEDMLPEGLTILAGAPKIGKSYMALDISISLSAGDPVLGHYQTSQGEALYLSLEDNNRRLQQRVNQISPDYAKTSNNTKLHLCTEIPNMSEGGIVALEQWLDNHPDCRLVIIDTLAKFLPPSDNKANAYQADYQALGRLQKLALKHGIALVVVHHVRKMKATDVLDEVSGSAGFTGAADAIWVLKRARTESTGTMLITGRDVDEIQLSATFDKETSKWTLDGDARQDARRKTLISLYGQFREQPFTYEAARTPLNGCSLRHATRIVGGLVDSGYATKMEDTSTTDTKFKPLQFTLTERVPELLLAGGES